MRAAGTWAVSEVVGRKEAALAAQAVVDDSEEAGGGQLVANTAREVVPEAGSREVRREPAAELEASAVESRG